MDIISNRFQNEAHRPCDNHFVTSLLQAVKVRNVVTSHNDNLTHTRKPHRKRAQSRRGSKPRR